MKFLPRLVVAAAWFAAAFSLVPSVRATQAMQNYVSALQPGWNLGNTLDAIPDETSWGNPLVTQAFIQQIAAQGFKSIRIPVTWSRHLGAGPNYTVDAAWMNRVQQIVDWSLQAGLHVMLNAHHDSWEWVSAMPTNRDAVLAKYRAVWTQVATRFRDYPSTLMFESINEPAFENATEAVSLTLLDELNTAFFRIVRDSGSMNATRPLVLPTLATGSNQAYLDSLNATITKLNDPNLIATIHYYGYWQFSVNIAGSTRFDATASADVDNTFDRVAAAFTPRTIPVIVGEFGLLAFDNDIGGIQRGEMLKYFEYFTQAARAKNFTHMLWDNGQHFNRATYAWRDPDLYAVIMRGLAGRSTTADTDQVWLLAGATVADTTLTLNLNGNAFVSLFAGTTALTAGTDYTVNGSLLTLKAATLSRYATGGYGEKAILTANFSAGPAWKIRVRYSAAPTLSASTLGSAGALTIPTAFNGDQLATMQAVYATGGNAGPQNWTAYKEFTYAFVPDYTNGTITVTKKFFDETTSGRAINFTFHFWSGRTVSYAYANNSGAVSGTGDSGVTTTTPSTPTTTTPTTTTPTTTTTTASSGGGGGGGGGAPSPVFLGVLALLAVARGWHQRRTLQP